MSDFINTIDIIGDDALMDGLIERSIGSFSDDKITSIRFSAFRLYTNLESVSFPNATAIGDCAFYGSGLKAITPETFPLMTSVGGDSFSTGVFRESTLETVDWPSLERTTNGKMFYGCKSLVNVNLPNLTSISEDMFINCTALKTITLPLITAVSWTFEGCTSLQVIDLPSCTSINWRRTFTNCYLLDALILRSTTMCAITGSLIGNDYFRPFGNSGIEKGTGYIYVPRDLVESYKADTNWSEFAAQFRPLEDYTVDGTITGATREHCTNLSLNVTELTFTDANSQTLPVTGLGIYDEITWTTSDGAVARVNANGVVTPISDGTATITVTCGEHSATCAVTVNAGLTAPSYDVMLTPYDGSEEGELPFYKLDVTAGQVLTLQYLLTKQQGYIYDGRNCGMDYYGSVSGSAYPMSSDEVGVDTIKEITIVSDGTITFSGFRNDTVANGELSTTALDRVYGKYLYVTIN